MIAVAKPVPNSDTQTSDWHARFLAMLPTIRCLASKSFRNLPLQARQDAVEEVIANALVAFVRLVEFDEADLAYPTPLAAFCRQACPAGRHLGGPRNVKDVMSTYAQEAEGLPDDRLDRHYLGEHDWQEILVEDMRRHRELLSRSGTTFRGGPA